MFFRKKRSTPTEADIQAIRQETLETANKANKSMDKLINLLDDDSLGITGKIFLATGGDKRTKTTKRKK